MPTPFGPYELLEQLGEGGMAEVWSAKKRGSGGFERVVCIKRIRLDQRGEADMAERFLREARVLGRLHHANIAQIYDAGQVGDEYFIEMEFLHGKDLRSLLKEQLAVGPPPPGLAISVVSDIGRALDHAHRLLGPDGTPSPIVHRDVTASNVMLGFDGSVKLVDFGLAKGTQKSSEPRVTTTGVFVGTVGYIAPEVVKGANADAKSDQFSLGVVLYETLTGRRLLDAAVARERPPSQCNTEIPAALDAVCLRALADDPMARFSSCGSFVSAIDAAAPRLGIGAAGIAKLLEERFGGSKLESPSSATTMRPAFVKVAAPAVPPAATTEPQVDAAPRTAIAKKVAAPSAKQRSSAGVWLAAVAAVALLAAAVVYRLRSETAAPVVATPTPTAIDAALPAATPDAAIAERAEDVPKSKRRRQRDLMDPFSTTNPTDLELMEADRPAKKKKKRTRSDPGEDMSLFQPKF